MTHREPLDLEAFRAIYPWPDRLLQHGAPMEVLWRFDLPCTPAVLWPLVADTSRFNRSLGLPEMHFDERDGVRYGEANYAGIRTSWVEEPWQWVREHYLRAFRVYQRGFAHVSQAVYRIDPLDEHRSRLYTYFGMVPRGVVGRLWTSLGLRSLRLGYHRAMGELAERLTAVERAQPARLVSASPGLDSQTHSRIQSIRETLTRDTSAAALVDKLIDHVTQGDDMAVYRLQVPALALEWRVDEDQLLRVCLHATRAGLLDMSWDVICPHCRGVREEARTLGDVPGVGTCAVCAIDFTTEQQNVIEITFHVHSSIRDVPKRFFCSAEPSFKDHIHLQLELEPGDRATVASALEPGRYRARIQGEKRYRYLDVDAMPNAMPDAMPDDTPDERAATIEWCASETADLTSGPRPALLLHNDTDAAQTFIIENAQWLDLALRPARLFNLQEFRDLFSEEYLAADVRLAVGSQAILFTDMVGSTRFYANRGDPEAFAEIKKHFTEVYAIVDRNHGAVVKTIGDAVMASFSSGLDAVRAAKEIHECFHHEREDTPIRLRISLNVGPCIAVNLNSGIDYFGGTVNIAAKLQACAEAGDIAMTHEVFHSDGVSAYLEERAAAVEESAYHFQALDTSIPVYRWATHAMQSRTEP